MLIPGDYSFQIDDEQAVRLGVVKIEDQDLAERIAGMSAADEALLIGCDYGKAGDTQVIGFVTRGLDGGHLFVRTVAEPDPRSIADMVDAYKALVHERALHEETERLKEIDRVYPITEYDRASNAAAQAKRDRKNARRAAR